MDSSSGNKRDNDEIEEKNPKKIKSELDSKSEEAGNEVGIDRQESHFLRLFTTILNAIMAIKGKEDSDVAPYMQPLIHSYTINSGPDSNSAVDFTKWENVCCYLFRYGTHGAGLARNRISNAIKNCEEVKKVLGKKNLSIIFFGSGPANDAIGLCSALSELHYPNLEITMVDMFEEWSLCTDLAEIFIKNGNFGKVSELFQNSSVDFNFLKVDLPGNPKSDKEYFRALKKADVIVLSKFCSILDRSIEEDRTTSIEEDITKSLSENVTEDAVILLLDMYNGLPQDVREKKYDKYFRKLYTWGDGYDNIYTSTAKAGERFGRDDNVYSKLPITVLKKQPLQ